MRTVIALLFVGLVGVLAAQTTADSRSRPCPPYRRLRCRRRRPSRARRRRRGYSRPTPCRGTNTPDDRGACRSKATGRPSGQRQTLATDIGRRWRRSNCPARSRCKRAGLSRGFRGEVIGFDDGAGVIVGGSCGPIGGDRSSASHGDALASAGRLRGTITGGTGRYAGVTGEYEFRWQHLIAAEGNSVNGRAVDLRGRRAPGAAGSEHHSRRSFAVDRAARRAGVGPGDLVRPFAGRAHARRVAAVRDLSLAPSCPWSSARFRFSRRPCSPWPPPCSPGCSRPPRRTPDLPTRRSSSSSWPFWSRGRW